MGGVFKKYDIRGVYPDDIDEELVYRIGRAIADEYSLDRVIVGYDYRKSSEPFFRSLSKGFNSRGCRVVTLGNTATPVLYRECIDGEFPIGIMITASHNPKDYNGLKICTDDGLLVTYGKGLEKIEERVGKDQSSIKDADCEDMIEEKDVSDEYSEFIGSMLKGLDKRFKISIDAGNGVAGPLLDKILGYLDGDVDRLFFEPDGDYPNHDANPLEDKNLDDLKASVKKNGSDAGFAFDGDADRCVLLDEKGDVVNTDMLLCLIATEEAKNNPGSTFYYDLRFSKVVKEHIESLDCNAIMNMVGNAFYKEKLVSDGGLVAAELSGHVMFSENKNLDDGFYLVAKAIRYMDDLKRPLSELVQPFKKYWQTPEINMKVDDADAVLAEMKERFKDQDINELDGVTVSDDDWWFNIRKSNTEPLVRMRIEADTETLLEEKKNLLEEMIAKHKA